MADEQTQQQAGTETIQPVVQPQEGQVVTQPGAGTGEAKTAQVSQSMETEGAPQWVKDAGFDTFEAFKEAYDKGELDPATGKKRVEGDTAKKDGEGEEKPKEGDDNADPLKDEAKVNEVKTRLKEAGGIYADPRYEQAALEFELKGEVSEETKAKAATDFNVPIDVVNQFIEGQKAQRALAATQAQGQVDEGARTLQGIVGGAEEYGKFQAWANTNLSAADQEAYNKALANNDVATASALLKGFHATYKEAGNGPAPRDVTSEGSPSGGSRTAGAQPFSDQSEMETAMSDPRYKTSEAYRKQVAARVAASDF